MHALLDSESTTAAYRFTIRPGDTTVFDVEMAVYPRIDLDHAGLMPMTSMFFFGPNDRNDVDDFRPSVHDSDGLRSSTAAARNSGVRSQSRQDLQISTFADRQSPRLRIDAAAEGFFRVSGPRIELSNAGRACGRSRSETGAKVRFSSSKFLPRKKFTTTSRAFGSPRPAAGQGRAYLYLSPALGTGHAEADARWLDFPEPPSAQRAITPRYSCSI